MSASPGPQPQAGDEGQTPQAGNPTTPQTPQAGEPDELAALSQAELARLVRDLRKSEGNTRTKLRSFEREAEQRRQAELSEVEKRDARIRQLEEGLTAAQAKERDYALRDGIAAIVTRDDFPASPAITAKSLIRLLDQDKIQWSEDGTPKNLPALLVELVRDEPSAFRAKERRPGPGDAGHFGTIPNAADMNAQIRQKAGRG